jgi:hypothetical protein
VGSCSVAIRRRRPPQWAHANTSMPNARCIREFRGLRPAQLDRVPGTHGERLLDGGGDLPRPRNELAARWPHEDFQRPAAQGWRSWAGRLARLAGTPATRKFQGTSVCVFQSHRMCRQPVGSKRLRHMAKAWS